MTLVLAARLCAACGCYLASDNDGELCWPCEHKRTPPLPALVSDLEPDLYYATAALLLWHLAWHDRRAVLGPELRHYGIETTAAMRHEAVRWANRRGIKTVGEMRLEGIEVLRWEARFRRR